MTDLPVPLVSTDWLASQGEQVKRVDASWHMPDAGRQAHEEFHTAHIPGAVFFDLDAHSATDTTLPHMLPSATAFADAMGALGIGNDDAVVIYDSAGLFSAARLWWMLRYFGHHKVSVLDGGLPKWRAENRPIASGAANPTRAIFTPRPNPALCCDKSDVTKIVGTDNTLLLDARSAPRFSGAAAEPRAGLRSGHIPGSRNLPYTALLHADGTMKPAAELEALLAPAHGRPVISTCGSGVTACIIDLALERIGHRNHAVYDGSWAEWGADPACPIATGEAA